jgi:ParB family chromosome partitioning protein
VALGSRHERPIPKGGSAEKRHFHYLNQLTAWGYTASAVEKIILDKHTTDTE